MKASLFRAPLALLVLVSAIITLPAAAQGIGRGALRNVVGACVVAKSTLGLAFPCADVRLDSPGADGYAIIRSPGFSSEFLLAPTAPMDGIESSALETDAATGFWQAAWAARQNVSDTLGHPLGRTDVALAVNASGTRTQDHFHIHVDCVRQSVIQVLSTRAKAISDQWAPFPARLQGETYWVRTVAGADLGGVNVARLIADAPQKVTQPIGHATLALVGAKLADGSDGFYLLANWANSSAERLLDHDCKGR